MMVGFYHSKLPIDFWHNAGQRRNGTCQRSFEYQKRIQITIPNFLFQYLHHSRHRPNNKLTYLAMGRNNSYTKHYMFCLDLALSLLNLRHPNQCQIH